MMAIILLAVALAMDAFAVALIQGAYGRLGVVGAARIAIAFGLAQGLMPLVGWALGLAFTDIFKSFDHWLAFALLGILGIRMIGEGLRREADEPEVKRLFLLSLLVSALATSIDAAAAGLTLPLLGQPIPIACFVIAGVTGTLSFAGALLGRKAGARAGKRAEVIGGVLLFGLGVKILLDHTGML
jgi:manganese efflux pump family protein